MPKTTIARSSLPDQPRGPHLRPSSSFPRTQGAQERSLTPLATGDDGRLGADALVDALAAGGGPTIVILDAGDLNVGACAPFEELIPIARAASAWVHIDGALGLWVRTSREHRHLVGGVELADSWATDAHKWLNTPQDNGIAIVRERTAHRAANAGGTAFFSVRLWRGRRAMRISVVNWRTSDADVLMTVQAVGRALAQMNPAI